MAAYNIYVAVTYKLTIHTACMANSCIFHRPILPFCKHHTLHACYAWCARPCFIIIQLLLVVVVVFFEGGERFINSVDIQRSTLSLNVCGHSLTCG